MNRDVYASSKTCEWETPRMYFEMIDRIYNFDLDVCATKDNAKCARYFTKEQDGLKQKWEGSCWMNPPYGREIGAWMKKAYESSLQGATVVCLVPARTDTAWWHDYAMKGKITFLRGRLKFGGSKCSAPFPSALVVFRGRVQTEEREAQGRAAGADRDGGIASIGYSGGSQTVIK